jgi:hypothetical protein
MSIPKVGDRVKVTVEGVLTETPRNEQIWLEGGLIEYTEGVLLVSIGVITPPFVLPTKKWAQVLDVSGRLWTRDLPGVWWSMTGNSRLPQELEKFRGLRIISEGVDK